MMGRNRSDRGDVQSYNRDAGHESRFGSSGMKGFRRPTEFESEADWDRMDRASFNADEGSRSSRWMAGEHIGKGPKGYHRSDERIREDVCEKLMQHGEIDASDIEVQVRDAIVDLSGEIESRRVKRLVEDVVEEIPGVRDINNHLRIAEGLSPTKEAGSMHMRVARKIKNAPLKSGSQRSVRV